MTRWCTLVAAVAGVACVGRPSVGEKGSAANTTCSADTLSKWRTELTAAVDSLSARIHGARVSDVNALLDPSFLLLVAEEGAGNRTWARAGSIAILRNTRFEDVQLGATDIASACSGELGHVRGQYRVSYMGPSGQRGSLGVFESVWQKEHSVWTLRMVGLHQGLNAAPESVLK